MRSTILPERADDTMICSVFSKPCPKQQQRTATSANRGPKYSSVTGTVPMPVVLRVFREDHNRAADTTDHQGRFRSALRISLT